MLLAIIMLTHHQRFSLFHLRMHLQPFSLLRRNFPGLQRPRKIQIIFFPPPLMFAVITSSHISSHTSWVSSWLLACRVSTRLQLCCSLCWMKASSVENSVWQRPHLCTSSSDIIWWWNNTVQDKRVSWKYLCYHLPFRLIRVNLKKKKYCWLARLLIKTVASKPHSWCYC